MSIKKIKKEQSKLKGLPQVQSCTLRETRERNLSHISDPNRARLIIRVLKMWVNGSNLTYFFFTSPAKWRGGNSQEQAVREAFKTWEELGIGITFQEVFNPNEATIRIAFDHDPNEGSWSYIGRDCIDIATDPAQRTTNFGWDLTTPYGRDTALHEIGHILGFPHEHQNPGAGIVWDEDKVYENFTNEPNSWSEDEVYSNIIRKIASNKVDGSFWDKDSIMHYHFEAGLILEPSEYQNKPLIPVGNLSKTDIDTVKMLYPALESRVAELRPFESQHFAINAGEQVDYLIKPTFSRQYTVQTFGKMDTVMVLFEIIDGVPVYLSGDDDSGQEYNAKIELRLLSNREYLVSTRLYYSSSKGESAIMLY